jgi:ABC-type sugar transport system ATPase subunit
VSKELRHGEIVGLAGLDGEGQVAFLQAAGGIAKPHAGVVEVVESDRARMVSRQRDAAELGIAYIPGDRKAEGILPHGSILENFSLPNYSDATRLGLISRRAMRSLMARYTAPLKLRAGASSDEITSLSGGNQQKVIIARWLAQEPRILLLNDPTRGVDIVTKRDLYASLTELADGGAAVLFLSTEVEELTNICHRILVFRRQTVYAELAGDAKAHDVVASMFGVERVADIDLAVAEAATAVSDELKDVL